MVRLESVLSLRQKEFPELRTLGLLKPLGKGAMSVVGPTICFLSMYQMYVVVFKRQFPQNQWIMSWSGATLPT